MAYSVGDTVRVVRKVTHVPGWTAAWIMAMDEFVMDGKLHKIEEVHDSGGYLLGGYWFPHESLELVQTNTTDHIAKAEVRKGTPIYSGVMMYFPLALAAVAQASKVGNDQHNPGEPLHWARGKSDDHLDAMARHALEAGKIDTDGIRHSAKVAWRALANLQLELEREGFTL